MTWSSRALQNRPELASAQALVQAAAVRRKQAILRPFIPEPIHDLRRGRARRRQPTALFGNFGPRGDAEVGHVLGASEPRLHRRSHHAAAERPSSRSRTSSRPAPRPRSVPTSWLPLKPALPPPARSKTPERDRRRGHRIAQTQLREYSPGSPVTTRDSPHRSLAANPGPGPGPPRLSRFSPVL